MPRKLVRHPLLAGPIAVVLATAPATAASATTYPAPAPPNSSLSTVQLPRPTRFLDTSKPGTLQNPKQLFGGATDATVKANAMAPQPLNTGSNDVAFMLPNGAGVNVSLSQAAADLEHIDVDISGMLDGDNGIFDLTSTAFTSHVVVTDLNTGRVSAQPADMVGVAEPMGATTNTSGAPAFRLDTGIPDGYHLITISGTGRPLDSKKPVPFFAGAIVQRFDLNGVAQLRIAQVLNAEQLSLQSSKVAAIQDQTRRLVAANVLKRSDDTGRLMAPTSDLYMVDDTGNIAIEVHIVPDGNGNEALTFNIHADGALYMGDLGTGQPRPWVQVNRFDRLTDVHIADAGTAAANRAYYFAYVQGDQLHIGGITAMVTKSIQGGALPWSSDKTTVTIGGISAMNDQEIVDQLAAVITPDMTVGIDAVLSQASAPMSSPLNLAGAGQ